MNSKITWVDEVVLRKRWIVHVVFWLAILLLYGILFGRRNNNYLQTIFFLGLLMPVVIAATYFFNYYLIPRFIITGRYSLFILYSFYTILTALFLEMMVALLTFLVMAELRVQNMSPASVDIFFLLAALLMVVFFAVAIKMLLHWRSSKEAYQKLMRDKVETELKFLKTQLNPHFLFNTLNNLYYLTTEKSDKAPQAVMALSEILDYVMHSGKQVFVPLRSELKQVENYIALELLRYEDRTDVKTSFSGAIDRHQIGPMILMTLIENAFKHGVMNVSGKSWIDFNVQAEEAGIYITLRNSYQKSSSGNGIGLENLKSQLDYLYQDNYQLKIDQSIQQEYSIELTLHSR